jgi:hypothetical protein
MVAAQRNLSPKAQERIRQQHWRAVVVSARYRAKKNVMAQIRARGDKVHYYSARQIAELAEAELERNRPALVAEAKAIVEQC